MATVAGEAYANILRSGKRDRVQFQADVTIGGAGAVGSQVVDDPAIVVSYSTTGIYTFTFPKAVSGRVKSIVLQSPAGTVKTAWITTFSPTGGTGTLNTGNGGGTATNPASADVIYLTLELETRSDS